MHIYAYSTVMIAQYTACLTHTHTYTYTYIHTYTPSPLHTHSPLHRPSPPPPTHTHTHTGAYGDSGQNWFNINQLFESVTWESGYKMWNMDGSCPSEDAKVEM
jgi:hypothetical protein